MQEFPSMHRGIDLLNAIEAQPGIGVGITPAVTINFLSRIENADPTDPNLSEDNTGSSWGHYQFTSGSMTITSVIRSWDCVGSATMACKLIAAAVKTCKVARHTCFEQNLHTNSFLADVYLSNLIDELCDVWVKAGGVSLIIMFVFTAILITMVVKVMSMAQTSTTATPMDLSHDSGPPSSPPSSLPALTFVNTPSTYSAPSLAGKTLIGGTTGGSEGAICGGATGMGGGTIGTGAAACGSTAGGSTIGVMMGGCSTTGHLMTGDLGTGLLGHNGGSVGGGTTGKGSKAGVKPNMGLHVSASAPSQ